MKTMTALLARLALPPWLGWLAATVTAALLLGAFVDTLHDHLRRSQEWRQAHRATSAPQQAAAVPVVTAQAR